jgi:hypothetical protein
MRRRCKHLIKRRKATVNKVSRRRQNRNAGSGDSPANLAGSLDFFYDRYRYRSARAE